MSAQLASPLEAQPPSLRAMTTDALDRVAALERVVYPFPWTRGNFVDALVAGYVAWTLEGARGELVAYCVAMRGVDEMHLLNITVAPEMRRLGHARRLLDALLRVCRVERAGRLWLEVRVGNAEARATYERLGFAIVGVRRGYYPAPAGTREDAVVMSLVVGGDDDAITGDVHRALD